MSTGISYPAGLPPFLVQGHTREPLPVVEPVEMDSGHDRLRRWFISAPELADAATRLTQTEYDAWHVFFEDALLAGARSFYAPLAGPEFTTGVEWWEVRFAGPTRAAFKAARWTVSMRLRLLDGPYETRPLGNSLGAEGVISVSGDADLTVSTTLAGEGVISVTGDAELAPIDHALAAEGSAAVAGDADLFVGVSIPDSGDIGRLWDGLALTPGRSDYINLATQALIERAWMEISDGIH